MSSTEDVQFRCKLCQSTASSKQDMADHFMEVHAAMEIVGTPVKSGKEQQPTKMDKDATSGQEGAADDGEDDDDGSAADDPDSTKPSKETAPAEAEHKTPGKKKHHNTIRSTISHLVKAAEQASKDEWTESDGGSSASNKISQTVHAGGRELRKHKMKRKFEGFVTFDDQPKSKQAKPAATKVYTIKKVVSRPQRRVKPTKDDRSTPASTSAESDYDEIKSNMAQELELWLAKWSENQKGATETCNSPGCNLTLPTAEMKLHSQCHIPSYYGFRCPHCKFMHSRWRSMRCHVYDYHDGLEKHQLLCDWGNCTYSISNMWGLKRHVLREHIHPKVTKMMASGQEESAVTTDDKPVKVEDETEKEKVPEQETVPEQEESPGQEEVPNLGKVKLEVDCYMPRRKRRSVKKIKQEQEGDDDDQDEEGWSTVGKKKKSNRAAWLPSCTVCEAKNIAVEDMDTHMALHSVKDGSGVKCSECYIEMEDEATLKAHMKEYHKRMLKGFRCDKCKYAGDRHHDFKKHLVTHEDTKPCMCEVCGKLMSTSYNLKVHLLRVHATDEQKTIHCEHCTYKCADNIVLKDHMRFQHNLLWNGDPYRDIEKLHTFRCDKCSYVGRKEKSLKYHMRVHTENRQFRCTICTYASKTKNNLILHMRTHAGLKPIKCPQCEYRGATNKVVDEHVLSKHKGLRPFRCPCGWSTAYSGNMWKHMQEHRQKGDAFKDIAVERYGVQKSKKKKSEPKVKLPAHSTEEQQIVAIVHEFHTQEGMENQLSSDHQEASDVIAFAEVPMSDEKDHPDSSKYDQVAVLPIMRGELQLNNLVQAVNASTADGKGMDQAAADHQRQLQAQQDSQAANFLCKLAQAVTTGQSQGSKQSVEGKGIPVECEVQTSDGTVEQTIQELILW